MKREENQAGLTDYLAALWNRKWLIVAVTLGLMIVVALISLLTPAVWRVEMIIQPAKFLNQNQAGQFIDVLISDPRQIATTINQGAYDAAIASDLKADVQGLPRLKAEFLKDTRLVKVSANAKNPEKAVLVLRALFLQIKNGLDKKILIEINAIDTDIKKNELQAELLAKEIAILANKLKILDQREREILEEKKAARERIARIEKEQAEALKSAGKEVLAQLVYSNIIQQSYEYINALDESISEKRARGEDLVQRRREAEQAMEVLKNSIISLKDKKGKYDYTEMIKEPTSSGFPVSPRKTRNILLAGILGVLISGLAALTWGSFDRKKAGGQ